MSYWSGVYQIRTLQNEKELLNCAENPNVDRIERIDRRIIEIEKEF
jgi:hypothetical protein